MFEAMSPVLPPILACWLVTIFVNPLRMSRPSWCGNLGPRLLAILPKVMTEADRAFLQETVQNVFGGADRQNGLWMEGGTSQIRSLIVKRKEEVP